MGYFLQYPGLCRLLYILNATDFVVSWRECCDQQLHAQLVTFYYSNEFQQKVDNLKTYFPIHYYYVCSTSNLVIKEMN